MLVLAACAVLVAGLVYGRRARMSSLSRLQDDSHDQTGGGDVTLSDLTEMEIAPESQWHDRAPSSPPNVTSKAVKAAMATAASEAIDRVTGSRGRRGAGFTSLNDAEAAAKPTLAWSKFKREKQPALLDDDGEAQVDNGLQSVDSPCGFARRMAETASVREDAERDACSNPW